jgi:hypothetical protein
MKLIGLLPFDDQRPIFVNADTVRVVEVGDWEGSTKLIFDKDHEVHVNGNPAEIIKKLEGSK